MHFPGWLCVIWPDLNAAKSSVLEKGWRKPPTSTPPLWPWGAVSAPWGTTRTSRCKTDTLVGPSRTKCGSWVVEWGIFKVFCIPSIDHGHLKWYPLGTANWRASCRASSVGGEPLAWWSTSTHVLPPTTKPFRSSSSLQLRRRSENESFTSTTGLV